MTTRKFETEVTQLLHLIIHSLYSHKEIFLRELVSNSSDALDKLKLLTLTNDNYRDFSFEPRIDILFSEDKNTIEVRDTGIGMNEADLIEQLGTIARSGTKSFLEQLLLCYRGVSDPSSILYLPDQSELVEPFHVVGKGLSRLFCPLQKLFSGNPRIFLD